MWKCSSDDIYGGLLWLIETIITGKKRSAAQQSVQPTACGAGGRALKSLQALWFAVESSATTGGG
jgi:hypothetical protein